MAFAFNGVGTIYYGKKQQPDGSYVTTKWFAFLWLPLVPLGSFRVTSEDEPNLQLLPSLTISQSRSLRSIKVALDKKQVAMTYAVGATILGMIALMFIV